MRTPRGDWAWLSTLPEARLFVSFWGSLVAIDAGRLVHASGWLLTGFVWMVVAASGSRSGWRGRLLVALVGWLCVTGFVVRGDGSLAWEGTGDALRLLVLLAAPWVCPAALRHLDAILMPTARDGVRRRPRLPEPARTGPRPPSRGA